MRDRLTNSRLNIKSHLAPAQGGRGTVPVTVPSPGVPVGEDPASVEAAPSSREGDVISRETERGFFQVAASGVRSQFEGPAIDLAVLKREEGIEYELRGRLAMTASNRKWI